MDYFHGDMVTLVKPPHNSLCVNDRQKIKIFLTKYANDNALPLPGRLPNYKSEKVLLLPSDTTSVHIFDTDLCQLCRVYSHKLSTSGLLIDEDKRELLQQYSTHIEDAKKERDLYRQQCTDSKEMYALMSEEKKSAAGNPPCFLDGTSHYSWDYAQQVHYPHQAQQVGPIFFKTPRKCSVFGICSEGSGKQVFYLVDEAESNGVGKGANSVVSMAHHYFDKYGHGEKVANIHFDNCSGQNKNNIVLWYALWRVIIGLHSVIQYSMMIAGHTKFDPDWHFGVWKLRWRASDADTLEDIAATVTNSSRNGHNIPQLVKDPCKPVIFRDWKSFLKQYFKPLKNLNKFHHFIIDSSNPGVIICKELCDSPSISVNLLKQKGCLPGINDMPQEILPTCLTPSRQWYLFEKIREHCLSERSKDLTCPKPNVPKSEVVIDTDHNVELSAQNNITCKRKSLLLR